MIAQSLDRESAAKGIDEAGKALVLARILLAWQQIMN
jgi:hypothetical protein